MEERKEVSHDHKDRWKVGGDDHFELGHSLGLVIHLWRKSNRPNMLADSCMCEQK